MLGEVDSFLYTVRFFGDCRFGFAHHLRGSGEIIMRILKFTVVASLVLMSFCSFAETTETATSTGFHVGADGRQHMVKVTKDAQGRVTHRQLVDSSILAPGDNGKPGAGLPSDICTAQNMTVGSNSLCALRAKETVNQALAASTELWTKKFAGQSFGFRVSFGNPQFARNLITYNTPLIIAFTVGSDGSITFPDTVTSPTLASKMVDLGLAGFMTDYANSNPWFDTSGFTSTANDRVLPRPSRFNSRLVNQTTRPYALPYTENPKIPIYYGSIASYINFVYNLPSLSNYLVILSPFAPLTGAELTDRFVVYVVALNGGGFPWSGSNITFEPPNCKVGVNRSFDMLVYEDVGVSSSTNGSIASESIYSSLFQKAPVLYAMFPTCDPMPYINPNPCATGGCNY